MTDLFIWMINIGGVLAHEHTKVGHWKRLLWPMRLGEEIAGILWGLRRVQWRIVDVNAREGGE